MGTESDDQDDDDDARKEAATAEVEVMIAEPWARRRGIAVDAVRALTQYVRSQAHRHASAHLDEMDSDFAPFKPPRQREDA